MESQPPEHTMIIIMFSYFSAIRIISIFHFKENVFASYTLVHSNYKFTTSNDKTAESVASYNMVYTPNTRNILNLITMKSTKVQNPRRNKCSAVAEKNGLHVYSCRVPRTVPYRAAYHNYADYYTHAHR